MANPFTTLGDLLEDLFTKHVDNNRLDAIIEQNKQIISQNGEILEWQRKLNGGQATVKGLLEAALQNYQSVLAYLGAPLIQIPLSAEDQKALDDISKETLDLQRQAEGINTEPPKPQ